MGALLERLGHLTDLAQRNRREQTIDGIPGSLHHSLLTIIWLARDCVGIFCSNENANKLSLIRAAIFCCSFCSVSSIFVLVFSAGPRRRWSRFVGGWRGARCAINTQANTSASRCEIYLEENINIRNARLGGCCANSKQPTAEKTFRTLFSDLRRYGWLPFQYLFVPFQLHFRHRLRNYYLETASADAWVFSRTSKAESGMRGAKNPNKIEWHLFAIIRWFTLSSFVSKWPSQCAVPARSQARSPIFTRLQEPQKAAATMITTNAKCKWIILLWIFNSFIQCAFIVA